ncbi:MAG: hypothetical protein ABIG37_01330 [Nanoarchaeota archaeon]
MNIAIQIADFLNVIIFQNSWFFMNYWSIVHFITGVLVVLFFPMLSINKFFKKLYSLLLIFALWELVEFVNWAVLKNSLFRPEIITDIIWDILLGIIGGLLMIFIISLLKKRN